MKEGINNSKSIINVSNVGKSNIIGDKKNMMSPSLSTKVSTVVVDLTFDDSDKDDIAAVGIASANSMNNVTKEKKGTVKKNSVDQVVVENITNVQFPTDTTVEGKKCCEQFATSGAIDNKLGQHDREPLVLKAAMKEPVPAIRLYIELSPVENWKEKLNAVEYDDEIDRISIVDLNRNPHVANNYDDNSQDLYEKQQEQLSSLLQGAQTTLQKKTQNILGQKLMFDGTSIH